MLLLESSSLPAFYILYEPYFQNYSHLAGVQDVFLIICIDVYLHYKMQYTKRSKMLLQNAEERTRNFTFTPLVFL
jgi:hypothetical protein